MPDSTNMEQTCNFRPRPALGTMVKIQLHRGGHDIFETAILPCLSPGKATFCPLLEFEKSLIFFNLSSSRVMKELTLAPEVRSLNIKSETD